MSRTENPAEKSHERLFCRQSSVLGTQKGEKKSEYIIEENKNLQNDNYDSSGGSENVLSMMQQIEKAGNCS